MKVSAAPIPEKLNPKQQIMTTSEHRMLLARAKAVVSHLSRQSQAKPSSSISDVEQ